MKNASKPIDKKDRYRNFDHFASNIDCSKTNK